MLLSSTLKPADLTVSTFIQQTIMSCNGAWGDWYGGDEVERVEGARQTGVRSLQIGTKTGGGGRHGVGLNPICHVRLDVNVFRVKAIGCSTTGDSISGLFRMYCPGCHQCHVRGISSPGTDAHCIVGCLPASRRAHACLLWRCSREN